MLLKDKLRKRLHHRATQSVMTVESMAGSGHRQGITQLCQVRSGEHFPDAKQRKRETM